MVIKYDATGHGITMEIENGDANNYPKSYRVWNSHCYNPKSGTTTFMCRIGVDLLPDELNKGKNETGLERIKKFIKKSREIFGEITLVRKNDFANNIELPKEILEA